MPIAAFAVGFDDAASAGAADAGIAASWNRARASHCLRSDGARAASFGMQITADG